MKEDKESKTITVFDVSNEDYLRLVKVKVNKGYESWREMFIGECLE